jgi:hypothetical protein
MLCVLRAIWNSGPKDECDVVDGPDMQATKMAGGTTLCKSHRREGRRDESEAVDTKAAGGAKDEQKESTLLDPTAGKSGGSQLYEGRQRLRY